MVVNDPNPLDKVKFFKIIREQFEQNRLLIEALVTIKENSDDQGAIDCASDALRKIKEEITCR